MRHRRHRSGRRLPDDLPLRSSPRTKLPAVEHVADQLPVRAELNRVADPATFASVEISSSNVIVVILCGMVTRAP